MYKATSIWLSVLCCSCSIEGTKSSLDPISDSHTTPSSSMSNNEDVLRALYLLAQTEDGENLVWELHIQSKELTLLGSLDCPFSASNDKLAAMTADPKGILWGLSEEYQIMRITPATLACTPFPQLASTEEFQAESLAFIQQEDGTEFFLAGYYSNPQGGASTALARLDTNGIEVIAPITNFEGQDTVIDIDTTPDQRLFGYRGWGNLSELLSLNTQAGGVEYSQTVYIGTAQNFALLSDNQTHWLFTNTGPQGSQLHSYRNEVLAWWMDIPFVVVGASGIE